MSRKAQTRNEYERRIFMAVNYICENIDAHHSLDDLAKLTSFSKFHFHRIFRFVTGETVSDFARRLKMQKAAHKLLSNPRQDITTIAFESGYSSPQNFAKAFRKQFHCSPSEFRRNIQWKQLAPFLTCRNMIENRLQPNADTNTAPPTEEKPSFFKNPSHYNDILPRRLEMNIRDVPERTLCYVRATGMYGPLLSGCAFAKLMHEAGPLGLSHHTKVGVYHDNPHLVGYEHCRYDAAIEIHANETAADHLQTQTVGGHHYLIGRYKLEQKQIVLAWLDMVDWIREKNLETRNIPAFEVYETFEDHQGRGQWVVSLHFPLKLQTSANPTNRQPAQAAAP